MTQRHQRGWLKKETRSQGENVGVVLPNYPKIRWQACGIQDFNWVGRELPGKEPRMVRSRATAPPHQQSGFGAGRHLRRSSTALRLNMNWSTILNRSMPRHTQQCDPTNG